MPKRKRTLTKRRHHSKIESMANEISTPTVITQNQTPKKILIAVLIGILVIAAIPLIFNFYQKLSLNKAGSKETSKPQKEESVVSSTPIFDTCKLDKTTNPLLLDLYTTGKNKTVVGGVFKGKVVEVKNNPVLESVLITLTSLDNKQNTTFNIQKQQVKDFNFDLLKIGQTVSMYFSCQNEPNSLIEFNKITILP